jgi:hypothetical protein
MTKKIEAEIKKFLSDPNLNNDEIIDFLGEKGLNQVEIDKYIAEYCNDNPENEENESFKGKTIEGYDPLPDDLEIEDLIRSKLSGISRDDIGSIKILAEVYNVEKKKWEALGSAIENLSLEDLDSEKTVIKDMIGDTYGPGWYKCKVHAAGKIRTAFSIELSDRKYKDPRKTADQSSTGNLDNLSAMMIANSKEDTKRLEMQLAETRKENHDLMMKMFESKKDAVNPIEYLKLGIDINKKDTSSDTIMREMFGLIKAGMTLREDAREAKDGQDLIARFGENIIDNLPGILSNLSGGKLGAKQAPVAAQIEAKGSTAPEGPGVADKEEKIIDPNKIDPQILQIAAKNGAYIGLIASIYLGYNNDDPFEAFSEQITALELYAELAEVIKKESDDTVIGRLCTLSPGILEYFKDDNFKKYVITIFEDVRKTLSGDKAATETKDDEIELETK